MRRRSGIDHESAMTSMQKATRYLGMAAGSSHRRRAFFRVFAGLVLAWTTVLAAGQTPVLEERMRETVEMVPARGWTESELELTHFRPPGSGPFPIVIINHGRSLGDSRLQPRYRPLIAAREMVARGYAVLVPMRQGFSRSGGNEITGGCNVHSNGVQQAQSVRRTVDWASSQAWADVSSVVVMGQSHGGLTTLAYGTDPASGVRLLVNFAGGLRQTGCSGWEHTLIRAFKDYGAKTRVPSLWFYGDNDSYFSPWMWKEAFEGYRQAGGPAELVAFGVFGSDAHSMFGSQAGVPLWLPRVVSALEGLGLPTKVLHADLQTQDIQPPAPSGFAPIDDLSKLPARARAAYADWLKAPVPKAFAVHPVKGSFGWAWGGDRPYSRALANCARSASDACRLYAVDDQVVWTDESKP
jgi:dienelactone hydrolase